MKKNYEDEDWVPPPRSSRSRSSRPRTPAPQRRSARSAARSAARPGNDSRLRVLGQVAAVARRGDEALGLFANDVKMTSAHYPDLYRKPLHPALLVAHEGAVNLGMARLARNRHRAVMNLSSGRTFPSVHHAARHYGVSTNKVGEWLRDPTKALVAV